jgi:bifunctional DNA-binding transcriptional regulator/antitoxin component of YhaV-PrlF toxin-antitoxin module
MGSLCERTVLDLGQGSYVICLPKEWCRYYGLKPGDKVEVISNRVITIRPKRQDQGRGPMARANTSGGNEGRDDRR